MTSIETTVAALTTEDIAALRTARSVTFTHYQGRAFVRAYMEVSGEPAVFTRREQILFPHGDSTRERYREIPVSSTIMGYAKGGGSWSVEDDDARATAFYMIMAARFAPTWVTIASLLTAGETVSLRWLADNNTEALEDAGLHYDRLIVAVKKGKRVRKFLVDVQVSPDNSARMIRRYGN